MTALEKLIKYFVNKHLLMNLVFVVVFIAGTLAWQNTQKEEMPDVTFDFVRIGASYPGATAEEVEHFLTKPIEEQVRGLDGVYRVTSNSGDGSCSVRVELEQNLSNRDEVIMEVRNAVLDTRLPSDVTDEPWVRVWKTSKMAIIDIALIDTSRHLLDKDSRKRLQDYAYALESRLLNRSEINSVNRSGYLGEELQILIQPEKLTHYNIPFNTVMREVTNNHVRKPVGNIEVPREPKVTLLSELDTVAKLKALPIQGGFEGNVIKLGQIADIKSGYQKNRSIIKVNGHECIMLNVVKNSSHGILEALDAVNKTVKTFEENSLKDTGIDLVLLDDESVDLRNRLHIIVVNGTIGFALILIMLFIFLDFRSGLFVAVGIPFTFFATIIAASMIGYTINNITLAAVIIVMGMIVDDAIVVSENISRLKHSGMASEEAAVKGTAFVFAPVIASILTTCVAFVPLMFFKGRFGRFASFIPPIIFMMLFASLFESLFILPGHMHIKLPSLKQLFSKDRIPAAKQRFGHWFDKVEDFYGRILNRVLPFKWMVFAGFILLLLFSGYIVQKKMQFVMFPHEETREISINGMAEPGTDRFATAELSLQVEDILKSYLGREVIGIRTQIARSRRGSTVEENRFRTVAEIVPKEKRKKSADKLIKEFEEKLASITDLKELKTAKSRWGQSSGSPIDLVVQDNNDKTRRAMAEELLTAMKQHPALENVEIEAPLVNPEYKISINNEKIKRLSIDPSSISSTLRAALQGTVLYKLTSGDEEIEVRFTTVDEAKNDIEKILDIPVENRGNYLVPIRDIVHVEETRAPSTIERKDSRRTTHIYADIKKESKKTPVQVAEYFEENTFPILLTKYPTTLLKFEGEVQDTRESSGEFRTAIIAVVFLIYLILVLLFNSLTKPLIIMLIIPFGIIGIILAFWLHGKVLFGYFAAIGALGLTGVVVNDSIILLAKLNKQYDPSTPRQNSNPQIADIAKTRLRAVLLTTLTTVAGLIPTAYGFAGYDAMLAEMMLAITWGLLFGTLITLVLVPCVYSAGQDLRFLLKRITS